MSPAAGCTELGTFSSPVALLTGTAQVPDDIFCTPSLTGIIKASQLGKPAIRMIKFSWGSSHNIHQLRTAIERFTVVTIFQSLHSSWRERRDASAAAVKVCMNKSSLDCRCNLQASFLAGTFTAGVYLYGFVSHHCSSYQSANRISKTLRAGFQGYVSTTINVGIASKTWSALLEPFDFNNQGASCGIPQSQGWIFPQDGGIGFDESDGTSWTVIDTTLGQCVS